jgi:hypothetical protein
MKITPILLLSICLFASPVFSQDIVKFDISEFSPGQKIFTKYYFQSILPWDFSSAKFDEDEISVNCDQLEDNLCEIISSFLGEAESADFGLGRKNWMENYLQTRENRGDHEIVPDTVSDFEALSKYKQWKLVTVQSRVKRAKRLLYQGELNGRKISVAETWSELEGREELREVELAVERKRHSNDWEFYAYNANGDLVLESEFPAGIRPAPLVCVSCHMSGQTKKASRFLQRSY